ncbi:3'-5' exonuclease [Humulus lupulus]|uniref:3'-5' exonuclease n=1 Tax=Humulus lupulus TaxID=3486 RepID=UPI002B4100CE|nr:3'-5' exonuclease [Humulus lupulus]
MECSNSREEPNNGSPSDWDDDQPFTLEDLEAIDAAFQSASKRPRVGTQQGQHHRRLPNSILALQLPGSSLSPCQAKAKMRFRYPVMKFLGPIKYSRTEVDVERASMEVLKIVEAKKKEVGQVAIGFDIEWRASFRKGVPPGRAAVMQICLDNSLCYVMHIFHSGIPKSLRLLLENSMFSKVGVGIGNDSVKISKDYDVSIQAVEELSYLAKQKIGGDSQKWSLASLTENLISKQLLKPRKIQLGNWETDVLSKDQLQYAATDAFASWYLYEVLRTLPDIEKVPIDDQSGELKDVSPQ